MWYNLENGVKRIEFARILEIKNRNQAGRSARRDGRNRGLCEKVWREGCMPVFCQTSGVKEHKKAIQAAPRGNLDGMKIISETMYWGSSAGLIHGVFQGFPRFESWIA